MSSRADWHRARPYIEAFIEAGLSNLTALDFDPLQYNQVNVGGTRELPQPSATVRRERAATLSEAIVLLAAVSTGRDH